MRVKTGHGWPHDVTKKDLRITHIKGSGPGGQHRNKMSSGVYMVHIPTGLSAPATEHRDQPQNLKAAFRKLCDQLVPIMKREQKLERYRASQDRVRTYHAPGRTSSGTTVDPPSAGRRGSCSISPLRCATT